MSEQTKYVRGLIIDNRRCAAGGWQKCLIGEMYRELIPQGINIPMASPLRRRHTDMYWVRRGPGAADQALDDLNPR